MFLCKYLVAAWLGVLDEQGWLGMKYITTESGDSDVDVCLYKPYREDEARHVVLSASEFCALKKDDAIELLKEKLQAVFVD